MAVGDSGRRGLPHHTPRVTRCGLRAWSASQIAGLSGLSEDKRAELLATVEKAQRQLAEVELRARRLPQLTVDELGRVELSAAALALTEAQRARLYPQRKELQHRFFLALRAGERALNELVNMSGRGATRLAAAGDSGPVELSDAAIEDQLIMSKQGGYNNCFFLTSLAAVAAADPGHIREHISWEEHTGGYRVRLYVGWPVKRAREYWVDFSALVADDRSTRASDGEPNFLGIYEAAYRQTFLGRLLRRIGGLPSLGLAAITGMRPKSSLLCAKSFAEIRAWLARSDAAVAVGTNAGWSARTDPKRHRMEQRIMPWHAYWVAGFDEQDRIILINPWGPRGGHSRGGAEFLGEVRLAEADFRRLTMQTALGRSTRRGQPRR